MGVVDIAATVALQLGSLIFPGEVALALARFGSGRPDAVHPRRA